MARPGRIEKSFGSFRGDLMASGKVKWWNNKSGFGFISQDQGQDVFVHHTDVVGNGFKVLTPGEDVTFEIVSTDKGPKAEKVQLARFQ
jgi:CspA family cold shock protein